MNLRGTFFLGQSIARAMLERTAPSVYRSIVTVMSANAEIVGVDRADYCMTKAALSMMSKLYATRLAAAGVHVFEIRPGIVRTAMTRPVAAKYDALIAQGGIPLGRWGTPDDVGQAVAALAEGRIPFATGEVINVGGGLHLHRRLAPATPKFALPQRAVPVVVYTRPREGSARISVCERFGRNPDMHYGGRRTGNLRRSRVLISVHDGLGRRPIPITSIDSPPMVVPQCKPALIRGMKLKEATRANHDSDAEAFYCVNARRYANQRDQATERGLSIEGLLIRRHRFPPKNFSATTCVDQDSRSAR